MKNLKYYKKMSERKIFSNKNNECVDKIVLGVLIALVVLVYILVYRYYSIKFGIEYKPNYPAENVPINEHRAIHRVLLRYVYSASIISGLVWYMLSNLVISIYYKHNIRKW